MSEQEIPLVSPDGELGHVPASEMQAALQQGYTQPNQQQLGELKDIEKFGTGMQQLQTGVEGMLSAATLGLAGPIQQSLIEKVDPAQAKQMFVEEQKRAQINPGSRMLGEMFGLGTTAGIGLGAAPIMELAGAKAASAVANPIGSMAAKMAVENMVFQAGSEVDKHFWQNADSAQSALVEVGLAGVLGGVTGAGLGGIKEMWKLGPGKQLQQVLESTKAGINGMPADVAAKAGIHIDPELGALMGEAPLQKSIGESLMDSGSSVGDRIRSKVAQAHEDGIAQAKAALNVPENPLSLAESGKIFRDSFNEVVTKEALPALEGYEKFEAKNAVRKLSLEDREALGETMSDLATKLGVDKRPNSPKAKLFEQLVDEVPRQETLQDLRNLIQDLRAEHPKLSPTFDAALQARQALEGAFDNILEKKVRVNAPNEIAEFQRIKQQYGNMKEIMFEVGDVLGLGKKGTAGYRSYLEKMSSMDPEVFARKLNLKEDVNLQQMLTEKFPKIAELKRSQDIAELVESATKNKELNFKSLMEKIDKMEPEYKNWLLNKEQQAQLEAIRDTLNKLPTGINGSKTGVAVEKNLKTAIPGAIGAAAAVFGHSGLMGYVLGHLGQTAARELPAAGKLAMLKFLSSSEQVSAPGFKAAVDMAQAVLRGETKLQQGAKAVFGKAAPVVTTFSATDREKLQKRIDALAKNPQDALHVGGDSGHYLPDHNASMVAASARAVQYLQSIKPVEQQSGLLGKPLPVNAVAQQKYDRALEIANNPQVVLADIRKGTLAPDDIRHLSAMYPQLMQRMQNLVQTEMIEAKNDGEHVPFKVQQALSLFLNQPIHGALTPASIQSTQPQMSQPGLPPSQQMLPRGPRNMNKLDKLPGMSSTPMQHREAFRTGSHK